VTANRPSERPRPFGPSELDGVPGIHPEELAAETRLARDIEAVAARGGVAPTTGFADRVMGAIATEPVPAPVIAAGSALRHRQVGGFLRSLRDAFRVAFGGGFPAVVRAQAFALVLLVAAFAGGSGLATAGALGAFDDHASPSPSPSPSPEPTQPSPTVPPQSPSPEPSATPSSTFELPTPSPDGELEPAVSALPETPEPGETQEPGDDGDQESGGGGSTRTPAPTAKSTPKPTPEPTEDHEDETSTPRPSRSPSPSPTEHD
jgi:hypothetical protein